MAILAAIIDRQFEPHRDDVLVVDQVVSFPDGDRTERFVVAQFNAPEGILVLRRYFPVTPGQTAKTSQAGDVFYVYAFSHVQHGGNPAVDLSDEPIMVIPVDKDAAISQEAKAQS